MPDLVLVKGQPLVVKVVEAEYNELCITLTLELIGPYGIKHITIDIPEDGLLEPGGPSA